MVLPSFKATKATFLLPRLVLTHAFKSTSLPIFPPVSSCFTSDLFMLFIISTNQKKLDDSTLSGGIVTEKEQSTDELNNLVDKISESEDSETEDTVNEDSTEETEEKMEDDKMMMDGKDSTEDKKEEKG